jgi:hypothetical protein
VAGARRGCRFDSAAHVHAITLRRWLGRQKLTVDSDIPIGVQMTITLSHRFRPGTRITLATQKFALRRREQPSSQCSCSTLFEIGCRVDAQ